ncbi:MAG: AAA family ATPase [Marinilabiliaceae bacterium]|nr:AAA family ATPase [Marinilabiliaceae bacterium]
MNEHIEFSSEAKEAINLVTHTRQNLYITGKAGTGKSTLLDHIRNIPGQEMVVLAPTGIAAIHVKGDTIHSFFKLKPGYELDEAIHVPLSRRMKEKCQALQCILIDEVSMLRADILDAIHVFLQRCRNNNDWFGGVRMIFFGDLYQLPPVVTQDDETRYYNLYQSPYFFSAHVFRQPDLFTPAFSLKQIELTKVYRQTEQEFIHVLNAIRENRCEQKDQDFINQLVNKNTDETEGSRVHLMGTNAQAYQMNTARLSDIQENEICFQGIKTGSIGSLQPNDTTVKVKVGAQVMFINNDQDKRWVNGSLGKVEGILQEMDEESGAPIQVLKVRLEEGKCVKVYPHTWEISKYVFEYGTFKREPIGTYTQIPIKLAWAITIHKSQGKSFNRVVLDLGRGSFAHGQTYVALSRCRSLKGLILKQAIQPKDIIVDDRIVEFMGK